MKPPVEVIVEGNTTTEDPLTVGATWVPTFIVPVQAEPFGQQATCPTASSWQLVFEIQQANGAFKLLQAL
jgi:hypothetical protein